MVQSQAHWDEVYTGRPADSTSWFQAEPEVSRRLVTAALPDGCGRVVDVGGGLSPLVDLLADNGCDVTVIDVSAAALQATAARLAASGLTAQVVRADVLAWRPAESYDVWHDRAVFHFLVSPVDRTAYVHRATAAVRPGGALVMATFAPDGPDACSGLPTARYDAQALAELFADGFVLEHAERELHRTPTETVQPFQWVVLRRRTAG